MATSDTGECLRFAFSLLTHSLIIQISASIPDYRWHILDDFNTSGIGFSQSLLYIDILSAQR